MTIIIQSNQQQLEEKPKNLILSIFDSLDINTVTVKVETYRFYYLEDSYHLSIAHKLLTITIFRSRMEGIFHETFLEYQALGFGTDHNQMEDIFTNLARLRVMYYFSNDFQYCFLNYGDSNLDYQLQQKQLSVDLPEFQNSFTPKKLTDIINGNAEDFMPKDFSFPINDGSGTIFTVPTFKLSNEDISIEIYKLFIKVNEIIKKYRS